MKEIYISPEDLKTSCYRRALKITAAQLGGRVIVDYSPRLSVQESGSKASVRQFVRQAKIGIAVPEKNYRKAKSLLKTLGFKIVSEDEALGLFEESIIISLLIPIEKELGLPIGMSLGGDRMVMLPLKRVLVYGEIDYRLPVFIANNFDEVCWVDSKGFRRILEMGFSHEERIPFGSFTHYELEELSRVIAATTIGDRYAPSILSTLMGGSEELMRDEEIPFVGRETEALREVLEWGVLSRERRRLRGKVFVDIQQLGQAAMITAIAAVLLGFCGLVIVNSEVWHKSLLPILNRREGIIWLSRNPAMRLISEFEYRVFKEGDYYVLSKMVMFEGELREIRERFIPLWEAGLDEYTRGFKGLLH